MKTETKGVKKEVKATKAANKATSLLTQADIVSYLREHISCSVDSKYDANTQKYWLGFEIYYDDKVITKDDCFI